MSNDFEYLRSRFALMKFQNLLKVDILIIRYLSRLVTFTFLDTLLLQSPTSSEDRRHGAQATTCIFRHPFV